MAGSYSHATTDAGNLRSNESFVDLIENLGDAYEMAQEMYGMIWWLAEQAAAGQSYADRTAREFVRIAEANYKAGLRIAREANRGR